MFSRTRRAVTAACESFEARRLLAQVAPITTGSSSDEIRIWVDDSAIHVEVNGGPATYPRFIYDRVSIESGGGGDQIYIDSNAGVPVTINSGSGSDQIHFGQADGSTAEVSGPVTLISSSSSDGLVFHDENESFNDSYTINNNTVTGAFSTINHTGVGSIKILSGAGADTFNVTNTNGANVIIDGQAGADILNQSKPSGTSTVTFENDQDFGDIEMGAGATLSLTNGAGLLVTANQSNFEGKVDLGSGFLVERNVFVSNAQGYWRTRLVNGNAGTVPSLVSSFAAGTAVSDAIGYGYAQELPFNTLNGYALQTNDFVLRYTLQGDANLDKVVNFTDLVALAQSYGGAGNRAWRQGDFNLSNTTDFADLVVLAQNYNLSPPAIVSPSKSSAKRVAADVTR